MVIDFHTHIFPPEAQQRREAYLARDATFAAMYANPEARIATVEALVAALDEAGVDLAVVVNIGWARQELCRETNDYILEAARRFPSRIVPFCSVNPVAGVEAVREVERCARAGARGIGELHPDPQGFDLGDAKLMAPVMEAVTAHNLLVLAHASEPVGHSYPGKGRTTPDILYRFVTGFPQATIVLAHWGGGLPFYALMPEVAEVLQHVYVDTAASPFLYRPQVFAVAMQVVGVERVLFGSDYPLLMPERALRHLRASGVPAWAQEAMTGGNARRLLGFSSTSQVILGPRGHDE